jgi:serine protease AprX
VTYCENESYTKLKNKIIMKNAKYSINANLVYKNGYSGKNVNIAVLDTGVFKHKQLDGCIKHFMDFVGGKETCYDDNGHGTHVCGILSAADIGMAPGQDYMCLRCLIILAWGRHRIQFVHLSI